MGIPGVGIYKEEYASKIKQCPVTHRDKGLRSTEDTILHQVGWHIDLVAAKHDWKVAKVANKAMAVYSRLLLHYASRHMYTWS